MATMADDDFNALEERFLSDLELHPLPLDAILAALSRLKESSRASQLEVWIQFASEKLVETGAREALLKLLALLATWRKDARAFAGVCHHTLKRVSQERTWLAFVDSVGWGEAAPQESLRRLQLLLQCQPGTAVFDKTWGFGIVKQVDDFYKRMTVDFTNKPNHALALTNAAANLSLVPPDHILAQRHRDRAAFDKLLQEQPDEVVRLMLRSFGEMPLPRLADLLAEHHLVADSDWKGFWDRARPLLKQDPLLELPAKRTEPLRLRQTAEKFDDAWFEALAAERSIPVILRRIEALEADPAATNLSGSARQHLSDRLDFALTGSTSQPGRYATIALTVVRLGLTTPDGDSMARHLLQEERFISASSELTGRKLTTLLEFLLQHEPDAATTLLAALSHAPLSLTTALLETLLERDTANATIVAARCRELTIGQIAPAPLLVWLLRNLDQIATWNLPTSYELLGQAIHYIEDPNLTGENLRMKHQLVSLFEHSKWFEPLFKGFEPLQREVLFARIQGSSDFGDATTQRSLVGKMIRYDATLAAHRQTAPAAIQEPEHHWTSWRTLNERQTQLRHLVEVEIPKNSDDIAHARSYGDLSENFEYHAAKQQQEQLLTRRTELENDLRQMRGTAFENVDTSIVNPGTMVTLRDSQGATTTYAIMGAWDNEPALQIIPNRSKLAQALLGQRVGSTLAIPTATGSETVTLQAITPLSSELLAWAKGS